MKNNPDYYNINGEDTIKTIIDIVDNNNLGTEQSIYLFNTLKYLVRFNNKNKIDDLIKAKDYLERLMEVYGEDEEIEDDMPEELVNIKSALERLGKSLRYKLEEEDLDLPIGSDFESLKELVLDWADDKDLLHEKNADKQFMKFMEEIFEFRDEWTLYNDELSFNNGFGEIDEDAYIYELADNMEDEMGDIFVTLIILCQQLSLDPVACLGRAYEKISKRKGKTINGQFIKQEDLEDWHGITDIVWQRL